MILDPRPNNRCNMSKSSSAIDYSPASDGALEITPAIGAEIHGVRLSGDLPAATVTAIRDARRRTAISRNNSQIQ